MAWFMNGILLWGFIMITLMAIGGFFMFRKFLKKLPKEDGKSMMDWEDEYIDQTRHLWTDETLDLLNALVMPVPAAFRDVARRKIAGRIGQFALEERASKMTSELVVKGYISATPKRDHKFLKKALREHAIDWRDYEFYFQS
ncbi:DUF2621 domain-containing protein [Exiguobacterium sp. RIT452]|jgi:hypothetical protein|uniref:DUF2621 domain-containing protein n=1 Tax=Exiguobacterium undae TaxID=169177 RepID=A0ABX2VDL4_9BACL|nr:MULTISPECIES: DUF2621 family protein [Exiguobacterium]OAN15854.1 hypothetical protein A3783_07955 [Exiguobacterium undae]RJP02185.1 DUF2621 domain-containing protein [Exiguobacterium sp. RIT452]